MQIRNSYVLYVCVLGLLISMTALSASATFSNASLKGGYSVLINRWTANSADNESALVGVMTFDGAGNVTLSFTIMSGGVLQTGNASGTYSLSPNGSGTITFTSGFSNPVEFAIVVNSHKSGIAGGMTLLRIDTNYPSDAIDSGNAILQSATSVTCSLASVKGTFSVQLIKWTPEPSADTEGHAILATFNGSGGWKASGTFRKNGSSGSENFSGSYTVNSDCSGTLSGGQFPIAFVLNTLTSTAPAKGVQILQAGESNGTNQVHSGVGLKQ